MNAKVLRYCSIVSSSLIRTPMLPSDPFPIERCSPRLKTAIMAEFEGRSPTFQDILNISPKEWMSVPGIGPSLLKELESLLQNPPVVAQEGSSTNIPDPDANRKDADLIARLEQLQRDLKRLQHDIQVLLGEAPSRKAGTTSSDLH
jgi:hypothetical protein